MSNRLPYGCCTVRARRNEVYRCRDSLQVSKFPQPQHQKRRNLAGYSPKRRHLPLADFSLPPRILLSLLAEYFRIALKRPVVSSVVSPAGDIHSSVALIVPYARLTPLILCTSGRVVLSFPRGYQNSTLKFIARPSRTTLHFSLDIAHNYNLY